MRNGSNIYKCGGEGSMASEWCEFVANRFIGNCHDAQLKSAWIGMVRILKCAKCEVCGKIFLDSCLDAQ